jgi:hypothetical protein
MRRPDVARDSAGEAEDIAIGINPDHEKFPQTL